MTNMESQGTAVYTARQYYQPNEYVEDTVQSLDFVEVRKRPFHLKSHLIPNESEITWGVWKTVMSRLAT